MLSFLKITKLKSIYKALKEKYIVSQYIKAGSIWGDAVSYSFMGVPADLADMEATLKKWEARYVALGYRPVYKDEWVRIGGYDEDPQLYLFKRDLKK